MNWNRVDKGLINSEISSSQTIEIFLLSLSLVSFLSLLLLSLISFCFISTFFKQELEQNLPVLTLDSTVLSSPPSDNIQVTWLGHASVLVQMDGFNILADPILNSYCGPTQLFSMTRYRPAPCTVNELPRIDAVCISHDHYDHLDVKTVKELHQRFGDQLKWYVPNGLKSWMASSGCKNAVELEWWEEAELSKKTDAEIQSHSTVKFVFTPTQHWCRRSATDKNQVLWGSWTILGPKHRFFFAGDTGYCKGFKQIGKRFGPFDFAAIPIGAYKPRLGKSICTLMGKT